MPKKRRLQVGIRELKSRASEIVGEVREHESTYTVTHRGEPVALLSPLPAPAAMPPPNSGSWTEFLRAVDEVGRRWQSEQSGLEILAEIRR